MVPMTMTQAHRTFHTDYVGMIDALRVALATPGEHNFHDTSDRLDRLGAEVRDVVAIHGRDDVTFQRLSPLVLRVVVEATR